MENNTRKIFVNFPSLRKKLKQEYRYSELDVLHTVWRLLNAREDVRRSFVKWFMEDMDPRLECENITWNDLVEKRGLNPYNAFLYMDTLLKDPEKGMSLIAGQMRPSLKLDVSELRPELREYVEKKSKENKEKLEGDIRIDEDGNIQL